MAYELNCRDAGMDCDFMIRSENEDELVDMVRQHSQNTHGKSMSESDVRDMMKTG